MLQTLTKGKLKAVLARGREPREDTVFGAVLGIARYQNAEHAWRMLQVLFGEEMPPRDEAPEALSVDLWQKRRLDGRFVEPDAIIDINFRSGRLRLILEAKWDARFHEAQASRQWLCFKQSGVETLHVFIVRRPEQAIHHWDSEQEVLGADVRFEEWRWCRRLVTWNAIAVRLDQAGPNLPSHLEPWRRDAVKVLAMVGEKVFEGFGHLAPLANLQGLPANVPLFFGSAVFAWPSATIPPVKTPVFFHGSAQTPE